MRPLIFEYCDPIDPINRTEYDVTGCDNILHLYTCRDNEAIIFSYDYENIGLDCPLYDHVNYTPIYYTSYENAYRHLNGIQIGDILITNGRDIRLRIVSNIKIVEHSVPLPKIRYTRYTCQIYLSDYMTFYDPEFSRGSSTRYYTSMPTISNVKIYKQDSATNTLRRIDINISHSTCPPEVSST